MTEIAPILGVLAAAIGVAGTVPYVRDILRGTTRPHRGTWLIWGVLAFVVCLSQRADGASWSLVMAGTHVVANGLVFALAIRHGEGGVSAADRAPSPSRESGSSDRSSLTSRSSPRSPSSRPISSPPR